MSRLDRYRGPTVASRSMTIRDLPTLGGAATLGDMTTMREQLLVRVTPSTRARLDAYATKLRRETGLRVPMTEIIRKLINDGLVAAGMPSEDEDEQAAGE